MSLSLRLAESGLLPDAVIRHGIRRRLGARQRRLASGVEGIADPTVALAGGPVAIATRAANRQHYELPPSFFETVLGHRMKYSCCYWPDGVRTLDQAEDAALELTCERAAIADGLSVLDLGCGWGSLSLWIAQRWPGCRVTAVSNSRPQGEFIRRRAADLALTNLETVTADINDFTPERRFDRIVSVEMFEHLRNYATLFARLAGWLTPAGRLFVHHFCHRDTPYTFEDRGEGDWMARHFFTGGLMPSERLLEGLSGPLAIERRWRLGGEHYEKTCNAWLARLDGARPRVRALLQPVYGEDTRRWLERWRIFFLACAELFAFGGGGEWFVSHSRWRRAIPRAPAAESLPSAGLKE